MDEVNKAKLKTVSTKPLPPRNHDKKQSTKTLCSICNKLVTNKGIKKHIQNVHNAVSTKELK